MKPEDLKILLLQNNENPRFPIRAVSVEQFADALEAAMNAQQNQTLATVYAEKSVTNALDWHRMIQELRGK